MSKLLTRYIPNITYISLILSGVQNSPKNLNPRRRWLMGLIMHKYGYLSRTSLLAARLGSARASSLPFVGLLGGWGPREMKIQLSSWILFKPFQSNPTNVRGWDLPPLTMKTPLQVPLQDFLLLNQLGLS